jgi:hypothetical protein
MQQRPAPEPPPQVPPTTPTFPITGTVEDPRDQVTPEIGVGDVILGTVGLIGAIVIAALVTGLLAGGIYIWLRRHRPITEIEARGHTHNYFRDH